MPNYQKTLALIAEKNFQKLLSILYGNEASIISNQTERFRNLVSQYLKYFPDGDLQLFSAAGRTEIGGNHTDHNRGKVLAGSITLDSIATASKTSGKEIVIYSEGYPEPFRINLDQLDHIEGEKGTIPLLKGIAKGFLEFGCRIGGFNAYITSNVANGSGLSSSASIEMLIGSILNTFYNNGEIDKVQLSRIGQFAENKYWGKPSGLLDQMTCAVGGLISIDFQNPEKPVIQKVDFDFAAQNYSIVIVNTGTHHADLTDEYASIPNEMRSVAEFFGAKQCREISYEHLLNQMTPLRQKVGDRAVLRAMHFFAENRRVDEQVDALKKNDFQRFLQLIQESGNSSWKWLQNCYVTWAPKEQGVPLTLAITENFITENKKGVCRVHGGGFAGVIQVFLPNELIPGYVSLIDKALGKNLTNIINIRPHGTIHINSLLD
ncbi:MAG TPA: galactokinase family protein [Bacillota bacterium]|nr:galactokinase family protein [Bacillota bacterium]